MARSKPNLEWIKTLLGDLNERGTPGVGAPPGFAATPIWDAGLDDQAESNEPTGPSPKTSPD